MSLRPTSATTATNRYESRQPSAPTKRKFPTAPGRLELAGISTQARKTASTTVWGLGVSASVFRDASVHFFYESSVHVHVMSDVVHIRQSDSQWKLRVGSCATSQAFWWTRTFEEHDGVRFAEGRRVGGRATSSKRRLLVMPMRARRPALVFSCARSWGVSESVSDHLSVVVDLAACGIVLHWDAL